MEEALRKGMFVFWLMFGFIMGYVMGRHAEYPDIEEMYYIEPPLDTLMYDDTWIMFKDANNNYFRYKYRKD
jgi:hypothetical protein